MKKRRIVVAALIAAILGSGFNHAPGTISSYAAEPVLRSGVSSYTVSYDAISSGSTPEGAVSSDAISSGSVPEGTVSEDVISDNAVPNETEASTVETGAEEAASGTVIKPVLAMNSSYEYAADIGLTPQPQVTMAGCKLTFEGQEEFNVEKNGDYAGFLELFHVKKTDLAKFRAALAAAALKNEGTSELPSDIEEMELIMYDEESGSYGCVAYFTAEENTELSDSVSDPVYFDIVPAKLRLAGGMDVSAAKYEKVDDVYGRIWNSFTLKRINNTDKEGGKDDLMYSDIKFDDDGDVTFLIDGKTFVLQDELTSCGEHKYSVIQGGLKLDKKFRSRYEISEFVCGDYTLSVCSDDYMDWDFKEGRKWYYGAPADSLPGLFDVKYSPGRDGSELVPDSLYFEVFRNGKWNNLYTKEEISVIPGGKKVMCRLCGRNSNDEKVAGIAGTLEVSPRPIAASANWFETPRANPLNDPGDEKCPYKTGFSFSEQNFTFSPVVSFDGWELPYSGEALTRDRLFSNDTFTVTSYGFPRSPYTPGRYETGTSIEYSPTDFFEKNLCFEDVDFGYVILPKYYSTYLIAGSRVYEGCSQTGKEGASVTYAAKCDDEIKIPEGITVYGWSFYDEDGYERIKSNEGTDRASDYKSGLDGTYTFTDTDVIISARIMTSEQGVQISQIEQIIYDGRYHIPEGMKADGIKKVADLGLIIRDGDYTLIPGYDYTVRMYYNKNAWNPAGRDAKKKLPRAVITGKGDYKGLKKTVYFAILQREIWDFDYTVSPGYIWMDKKDKVHLGKRTVQGILSDGFVLKLEKSDYVENLSEMPENGESLHGSYTITAYGRGNYTGECELEIPGINNAVDFSTYRIRYTPVIDYREKLSAEDFGISIYTPKGRKLDTEEYTLQFDEEVQTPAASGYYRVIAAPSSKIKTEEKYDNIIGTKIFYVRMKGEKLKISSFKTSWNSLPFDGGDSKNSVISHDPALVEGKDYTCEWIKNSDESNKLTGKYSVLIRGMGRYANKSRQDVPTPVKLVFKRTPAAFAKAENITVAAGDGNADGYKVTLTVKNADGTETIYTNHQKNGKWTRALVTADGTRGFAVTSFGKLKIKALAASGYKGIRTEH